MSPVAILLSTGYETRPHGFAEREVTLPKSLHALRQYLIAFGSVSRHTCVLHLHRRPDSAAGAMDITFQPSM